MTARPEESAKYVIALAKEGVAASRKQNAEKPPQLGAAEVDGNGTGLPE